MIPLENGSIFIVLLLFNMISLRFSLYAINLLYKLLWLRKTRQNHAKPLISFPPYVRVFLHLSTFRARCAQGASCFGLYFAQRNERRFNLNFLVRASIWGGIFESLKHAKISCKNIEF